QRQEVAFGGSLVFHTGGGEDDRVAVADGAGAVGLLGQVTCLDDHGSRANGDLFALLHGFFLFLVFSCLSVCLRYRTSPRVWASPCSREGPGERRSGGSESPETGNERQGLGTVPAESVGWRIYLRSPRRSMVVR